MEIINISENSSVRGLGLYLKVGMNSKLLVENLRSYSNCE